MYPLSDEEGKIILREWYVRDLNPHLPKSSFSKQQILSITENTKTHQKKPVIYRKRRKH